MEYPIDNPIWKVFFECDIRECKRAWRAKKERLERQYTALRDLQDSACESDVDRMDIDGPVTAVEAPTSAPTNRKSMAWSDEWMAELDQHYLNIERYMEDLQAENAIQGLQDDHLVLTESSNTMGNIQDGLMHCLTSLQGGKATGTEIDQDSDEDSVMTDCPDEGGSTTSDSASTNSIESQTTVASYTSTSPDCQLASASVASIMARVSLSGLSRGGIVMKHLFKWWSPRGTCARDTERNGEERVTEVDGLIH